MSMEQNWITVLTNWPAGIERKGIVVTNANESIEFVSYQLLGTVLLLERSRPDSLGGRRVMVQLSQVAMIKVVDPVQMEQFAQFGFTVPRRTA